MLESGRGKLRSEIPTIGVGASTIAAAIVDKPKGPAMSRAFSYPTWTAYDDPGKRPNFSATHQVRLVISRSWHNAAGEEVRTAEECELRDRIGGIVRAFSGHGYRRVTIVLRRQKTVVSPDASP